MVPTPLSSSAPPPEPELLARRRRWPSFLGGALAIAATVAAIAVGLRWWNVALARPGPLQEARAFIVPHGGTDQVAEVLALDGVVDQPLLFQVAVLMTRGQGALHAAELAFPVHASINEVLAILRSAHPVEHHLTIPEGLTVQQIVGVLVSAEAMTGDVRLSEEGALLPQTYGYEYGASRAGVVARARAAMDKELVAAWADRAPELPLSSPRDALILASIVERETAKPEERPHIAAVYLNRLRQGMKLQADPTVLYLASGGSGVLDHRLTRAELGRDDPFNTYRSMGLPPTPICSPGVDSIRAVLHPLASDDLFFVADGAGGHVFSRSYEAHDLAVTRWRSLVSPAPRGGPDQDNHEPR